MEDDAAEGSLKYPISMKNVWFSHCLMNTLPLIRLAQMCTLTLHCEVSMGVEVRDVEKRYRIEDMQTDRAVKYRYIIKKEARTP
jgi:hypothetical protein